MRPCFASQSPDESSRQQEIGILRRFLGAIDDESRPDEALGRDAVGGVVRQVLARDPVHRRVEVRAGVLAAGEVVPVPGRAALVVARHLLDAERPRLAHLRRQRDAGEFRRQCLRKVHYADFSGGKASTNCKSGFMPTAPVPVLSDYRASGQAIPAPRPPGRRPRCRRAARRRPPWPASSGASFGGGSELVPLVVDRPGKYVHHSHAGRAHLGAQALRQRMRRRLRCGEGAVRREIGVRIDRQQVDPCHCAGLAVGAARAHGGAELLREAQQAEVVHVHLRARGFHALPVGDAEAAVHLGIVDEDVDLARDLRRRPRARSSSR